MFQSINPVNQQVLKSFPFLTSDELSSKLELAEECYHFSWKTKSLGNRIEAISKVKEILNQNLELFAKLITTEMGKPIIQSRAEIKKCQLLCEYYIKNAPVFLADEVIKNDVSESIVTFQPIGAVFGIMPWNFPFWQVFRFAIPTLLAGNVVLLKHAPNVPQCALALEKLFQDSIDLKGVFQSLFIDINQVESVIAHKIVQGVTLTGSDRAGSSVAALAGKYIKKCVLELGGTDAFIVLKDADLENAAHFAIKSRMNNCGQTCISAKRLLVDESIAAPFKNLLIHEMEKLKIGDPFDESTDLSCLARPDLFANLERQVAASVKLGALELVKGGQMEEHSNFFKPILLTNINREMPVYKEEVFGPVAILMTFKDEKEALEIANDSGYGLGAAIWTNDLQKAKDFALSLEAGAIAINNMVKSDPKLPFGGVKKSGFGRELGKEGIREFVNIKSINFK